MLSKNALRVLLHGLDQAQAVKDAFYGAGPQAIGTQHPHRQPVLWKEFQHLKADRFVPLKGLYTSTGQLLVSPSAVANEVRSTHTFWQEAPVFPSNDLVSSLREYALGSPSMADIQMPDTEAWMGFAGATGKGAPGIDGIPYVFWQEHRDVFAALAIYFLRQLSNPSIPPPQLTQLLVWIPKADAGFKADNWRPLNLPTTFQRTIAYVSSPPLLAIAHGYSILRRLCCLRLRNLRGTLSLPLTSWRMPAPLARSLAGS